MLVSLTAVERYWRRLGFTPGVIDSMQLWALQRDHARQAAPRPLVFLGASRTLFGIDMLTVRAMLPGWQPVMLALNGRYPLAALRDLADDDAFRGTVVLDIDSRGLARSNHAAQVPYVRYYHDQWSPSWRWPRQFLNHWPGALAIGNPDLAIVRVLQRRAAGQPRPELPTHTTAPDRDSRLDFSRVDAAVLAAGFERGLRDALQVNPPPPVAQWQADLAELPGLIARIRQRGGDVIFYTPPVSGAQDGEQWLALEVLHRDEVATIRFTEVVDVDDVGVLDQGGQPRLLHQHLDERLLRGEVVVDQLDHHQLLEAHGAAQPRQLHLGHAALANACDQLVSPELPSIACELHGRQHISVLSNWKSARSTDVEKGPQRWRPVRAS